MAEQSTQRPGSLEQSQAAWTNFLRVTKVVVGLTVVSLILIAFATP
jgi:hypothetical protein